jgi:hypothetical protein
MLRCRQHQHDIFSRRDAADAVNDAYSTERPARHRGLGVACNFGFRHAGIVLKRQGGDGRAVFAAAANSAEGNHRADVTTARRQRRHFARDIEIGLLDADGHVGAHDGIAHALN